ncbi:hypothetical protein HY024_04400 [Candidatus Curtissbacteria bacterium]|nr:hypothetical protein [Candidatus Curtissbacteria bacterium]
MPESNIPIELQAYAAKKKEAVQEAKPLEFPPEIIEKLDAETLKHGRNECCGFVVQVGGKMEVVSIKNSLADQDGNRAHIAYVMD